MCFEWPRAIQLMAINSEMIMIGESEVAHNINKGTPAEK